MGIIKIRGYLNDNVSYAHQLSGKEVVVGTRPLQPVRASPLVLAMRGPYSFYIFKLPLSDLLDVGALLVNLDYCRLW